MVSYPIRSLWVVSTAIVFRDDLVYGFTPQNGFCIQQTRGLKIAPLASQKTYMPSDFSVIDDDDENYNEKVQTPYPDFSMEDDDNNSATSGSETSNKKSASELSKKPKVDDGWYEERESKPKRKQRVIRGGKAAPLQGASWMERNAKFTGAKLDRDVEEDQSQKRSSSGDGPKNQTFRQDFRGTRVFVQGIPRDVTWQTLKDHFREAGEVVFASVSTDPVTGESKGHGIVQYETTEMAKTAIAIMRNYPLEGAQLFVREDVQDNVNGRDLQNKMPMAKKGPTPPSKWKCANEDNASYMEEEERRAILQMLKARDQARRRRNYEASDTMREQLKNEYGVHIDDRLKMWWTVMEGNQVPPQAIQDIKGDGRWGDRKQEWRQIPTTPENDACVDPNLVNALLKQRDIARREKDFATADSLLEEARTSPDGDLNLRIHDESRTWRIWTEAPPPRRVNHYQEMPPGEQCIALVEEMAPHKVDEVRGLLEKFPGREWALLKKLKQRYEN